MNINFSTIKNIVFDLGNVVIDIDFEITFQAFADILQEPYEKTALFLRKSNINHRFETGQITEEELITEIQAYASVPVTGQQVVDAWNALLLEMPNERIQRIQGLEKKYKTLVLSNTNSTHINEVNKRLKDNTGISDLTELFTDTVYYSHDIGLAKPDIAIYQHILNDSNLVANETLFIDDKEENILGAQKLGIQTIHLVKPTTILDVLQDA
ncbi:MAG: HAD family hydrolase [Cyclobacteriaceae bacterium]